MKIGFSGTQEGMTPAQKKQVTSLLGFGIEEAHHGDCIGADADFNELCIGLKIPVILHPPTDPKKRAFCSNGVINILREKAYLTRNKDIVNTCDHLIATPSGSEVLRSGTWSTIRYAKKVGKPVTVVYPNGQRECYL